jgi:hypothetical protein
MNIGKLVKSAQRLVNKRGGTENLKEDAMELKDIASRKGSLVEKAKEAGEALKTPGDPDQAPKHRTGESATPRPSTGEPHPTAEKPPAA